MAIDQQGGAFHTVLVSSTQEHDHAFFGSQMVRLATFYYVLNPELRREKDQLGRDGLGMFIIDYSSVRCAYGA